MQVSPTLFIDEATLEETFIRASGPGGQNVNKLSTAVQLRFNLQQATTLPEEVRQRIATLAGRKLGKDGFITILARRYRLQAQNRADARNRLAALILKAASPPLLRKPTNPTRGSTRRRLKTKAIRAEVKSTRKKVDDDQ